MNKLVIILTTKTDKHGNNTYPLYGVCIGIIVAYMILFLNNQKLDFLIYSGVFFLLNITLSFLCSLIERGGNLGARLKYLWNNDLKYLSEKIKIVLMISATGPLGTIVYLWVIIKSVFEK